MKHFTTIDITHDVVNMGNAFSFRNMAIAELRRLSGEIPSLVEIVEKISKDFQENKKYHMTKILNAHSISYEDDFLFAIDEVMRKLTICYKEKTK